MSRWLIPTALACACVVPVLAGAYRGTSILLEGAWSVELAPERVDALPLFVHVLGAASFFSLAALQVLPRFRARHPLWHRRAGVAAWVSGLCGALSGAWMSAAHLEISGPVLLFGRLLFGPLWALFLILGYLALRRGDYVSHGGHMVRAFAVAMPAGTLPFIFAPFALVLGEVPQVLDESIQSCAWVLHLVAAELLVRRRRRFLTGGSSAIAGSCGYSAGAIARFTSRAGARMPESWLPPAMPAATISRCLSPEPQSPGQGTYPARRP